MFEAEDFDDGGQDSAYHDSDLLNNPLGGSPLRPDQSVDIEVTGDPDSGGGYNVGWFNKDEWLRYTVSTTTAGTYIWYARIASPCTGGTITLEVNNVQVGPPISIPNTGGWQIWQTVQQIGVSLPSGTSVVRVKGTTTSGACGEGGQAITNFNWFQIQ
jgi:hypothetical protein